MSDNMSMSSCPFGCLAVNRHSSMVPNSSMVRSSFKESEKVFKCGCSYMRFFVSVLKGNSHEQFNLKKTAWTDSLIQLQGGIDARQNRPAYDGSLAAKEITPDKRADSVNGKWPENLACCHKRLYLNACAAHDSFPLIERGKNAFQLR